MVTSDTQENPSERGVESLALLPMEKNSFDSPKDK